MSSPVGPKFPSDLLNDLNADRICLLTSLGDNIPDAFSEEEKVKTKEVIENTEFQKDPYTYMATLAEQATEIDKPLQYLQHKLGLSSETIEEAIEIVQPAEEEITDFSTFWYPHENKV